MYNLEKTVSCRMSTTGCKLRVKKRLENCLQPQGQKGEPQGTDHMSIVNWVPCRKLGDFLVWVLFFQRKEAFDRKGLG